MTTANTTANTAAEGQGGGTEAPDSAQPLLSIADLSVSYPRYGQDRLTTLKNVDLAMRYIDVLLSAEGQKCFAEKKYAGPVNTKVDLSDKVKAIVPFGASYDNLWYPDTDLIAKLRPGWTERWQREIAR